MAKLITGGVNFILDARKPDRKDLFQKEALLLKQAHSLCSSMTTETERHEAAYMEAIRSTIIKITYGGKGGKTLSLKEINDEINELLKAAVQSEGVISLFDSKKTAGENFNLFDPAVLEEISRMKEKNIAVEILKKLMAEQVSLYKRTNVVQSQKFSEKISQLMNAYYNGLITNEEVIKELLKTAEEIANLYKNGQKLGLSQEELAFYDALTKPEHIKDFYQNDELIALTKELTEMLRTNRTIDWQKKKRPAQRCAKWSSVCSKSTDIRRRITILPSTQSSASVNCGRTTLLWLNPKTTEQTVLGRMTIWMHGREISSRFSTETNSS